MNIAVEPTGEEGISQTGKSVIENGVGLYEMIKPIKNQFPIVSFIFTFKNFLKIFKILSNLKPRPAKFFSIILDFVLINWKA